MQGRISAITGLAAAAILIAACAASCSKEPFAGVRQEAGRPVVFSAYAGSAATKAASMDPDGLLGHWVDSSSTYVPGRGIGVFAFHQKAKSNGYPNLFGKNTGKPGFMYNQKVERVSDDGVSYRFEYSPEKYWPNNPGDLVSFFAYAPYDETAAWEDLRVETNLDGTKITRDFVIEEAVEDQTDFLWADPVLNMSAPGVDTAVDFDFTHLCSRLSVSAKVNEKAKSIYVTVDKVAITGRFTTSGTLVYLPEDGSRSWDRLAGFDKATTYVPFEATFKAGPDGGEPVYTTFVADTLKQYVHGEKGFTFVLPGTQDIQLSAVVSQRSSTTDFVKSYTITRDFPAMALQPGKAYNFFLNITLTPVIFTGSVDAVWTTGEEAFISPDNGNTWHN